VCGIAGIFNPLTSLSPEAFKVCRRMSNAMQYRGPDESGLFHDEHAALGHRRLSIIDLSTGQQPMHTVCNSQIIVFNGEIYNFRELRAQLSGEGYPFQTKSDTEVILVGYQKWGFEVVKKLRGMFAFAIYDLTRQCLFAARDPIGKKPLYYYIDHNGDFYFASDMQGLAASEVLPGTISQEAVGLYFNLGYIPAPYTIYSEVQKLKAGEALLYDRQGSRQWQYWDIDLGCENEGDEGKQLNRFEELLDHSVEGRLISEVPLGALLSGGIDSNLVVSTMARLSEAAIKTYTAGFDQKAQLSGTRDERLLASTAARFYGTVHEEITVDPNVGTIAPSLIPFLGEPFADSSIIPTYLVCRAARQKVTVALTGDGGDEPFGGYSARYIPHLMEQRIRDIAPSVVLSLMAPFFANRWPAAAFLPRWLRLRTIFRNLAVSSVESLFMDQAIWNPDQLPAQVELLRGRESAIQLMKDLYQKTSGRDELTRILYVDTKLYMAEDVLVKADRMSMANSLELRSPLLDQDIVSFAFSLAGHLKINNYQTKYLLKRLANRRVAPEIISQPKTGFSIPIDNYLRNHCRNTFEEHVFHTGHGVQDFLEPAYIKNLWSRFLNGDNRNVQFLWAVFVMVLWMNGFHSSRRFRSSQ
jgi:asparagine synthase (glutamine-hydrolysing)